MATRSIQPDPGSHVDLDTGQVAMRRGGGAFAIAQQSVVPNAEGGSDLTAVFQQNDPHR